MPYHGSPRFSLRCLCTASPLPSMLLVQQAGLGQEGYLLFSCSADRTIRVWDPAVRDHSKACVQTLQGHGGTVTSLAYCEGVLVSSSTDSTIRAWKVDDGRDLLLYPWFSPHLTLSDINCWVNALALQVRSGAVCDLTLQCCSVTITTN